MKIRQLKKKLFIIAGYLFITAILFVYLSYSAYRIKIESTVMMPQVYTMTGSITLDATQDILNPGSGTTQGAILCVNNDECKLDLQYTIEIETCGRLPLQFKLDDSIVKLDIGQTSAAFTNVYTLTGGALSSLEHTIEMSWNDSSPNASDVSLCREVDKVTVRPHIYATPFKYSDLEEMKIIVYKR